MREIVFDTETTGLDPLAGDRLVEIGCIELFNRFPTGKTFHGYFNPERDMPESALKIHGLTVDFLRNQPVFAHRVGELIDFLGDAQLVARTPKERFRFGVVFRVMLGKALPCRRAGAAQSAGAGLQRDARTVRAGRKTLLPEE